MPGRLHLQEGEPARIEPDPTPEQITTTVAKSRRKNVLRITTPSARQIHDFIHRISSAEGPLPLSTRRAARRAEKAAKNHT